MRLTVSLSAAIVLALLLLTACNSTEQSHSSPAAAGVAASNNASTAQQGPVNPPPTDANAPGDGVRRITTVELKNMVDKGQAVIVDVRGDEAWAQGHIHGARHITTDKILAEAESLPRDKTIVTYCT